MRHPFVVLGMVLLFAATASPQEKAKDPSERIEFSIDGMDLDRVVKLVSDELQIRILYDEKILKRKVNLISPVAVKRKDLLAVLQSILEMQNFTMVKSGPPDAELWKVVPFTAPIANPSNKGSIPLVLLEHLNDLPDGEGLATLLVALRNVDARSAFIATQGMVSDPRMVQAIETANVLLLTDTAQNLRRIGGVIGVMDQPSPVEGQASVAVETWLFEASAAVLASHGLRTPGSKEGKLLSEADAGALWSDLVAAAGSPDIRVLHRWSGRILEGVPMRTDAWTKSFHVRMSIVPSLPRNAEKPTPGKDAPAPQPGPSEGEVALSVGLDVSTTGDAGEVKNEDQTTLAATEGAWLVWSLQSAAQDGTVRLFFAKASR